MDGARRADRLAFAAEFALREIDVGHVVRDGDGVVRAGLGAEAAADAGIGAGLLRSRPLVLVDAGHVLAHAARALETKFDDVLGAGFGAGAAGGTLLLVHDGQARRGIHRQGAELARGHAVAATQAAESAARVAAVERGLDPAGLRAVVLIGTRTSLAAAVATDHRDLRGLRGHRKTENGSDLLHHLVAAHRAILIVQVRCFDRRIGESAASGEAAAAAVGARHHLLHFVNPRVLLDLELARHPEQDQRKQQAQDAQDRDGPDDCLSHYALMLKTYSFLRRPRRSQMTP